MLLHLRKDSFCLIQDTNACVDMGFTDMEAVMIVLTEKLLDDGKSVNGAFNKRQVETLGLKWGDLRRGWIKRLIGCSVSEEAYEVFIQNKDSHLSKDKFLHRMLQEQGRDRLRELIRMAEEIQSIDGNPSVTIKRLLEIKNLPPNAINMRSISQEK